MKKLKVLLVGLLLVPFMMLKVNAAGAPYAWIVSGEQLGAGKSNTAQTAKQVTDGKTVTLTLTNYDGGKIELTCYGTGQEGMTFIVELVGENVINSDDVGIQYSYDSSIQFKGDGKLTINAPTPTSYSSETNTLVISPSAQTTTEEVTTSEETTTEEATTDEEATEEEDEEEKDDATATTGTNSLFNNIKDFLLGFGIGIGAILVIVLFKKILTPKKTAKPAVATPEDNQSTPDDNK